MFGGRGMSVAPGYDDLAGVVQKPCLHADHARRTPALIVLSAEERQDGRQRSELLNFAFAVVFDKFRK